MCWHGWVREGSSLHQTAMAKGAFAKISIRCIERPVSLLQLEPTWLNERGVIGVGVQFGARIEAVTQC